jgi:hypothetical protein
MITLLNLFFLKSNFILQESNYANHYVRSIELIRDSNLELEIAFFDHQLNSENLRLKSVKVDRRYEQIFMESGLELETKYPIELFGLSPFPIDRV